MTAYWVKVVGAGLLLLLDVTLRIRCYQFSVIYKLQIFTSVLCWCGFDRGLIRYFSTNRSFTFNPCVLQTISCLDHKFSKS